MKFSKDILAELKIQSEKLRRYPGHHVNCYIHVNSDLCNCGTAEVEEEEAKNLEEENAIQEENTPLDSESRKAYYEAMSKDN